MLSRFHHDPFMSSWPRELQRMRRAIDGVFGDTLDRTGEGSSTAVSPWGSSGGALWAPRFDVSETEKAVFLQAELPGLRKEDIKIELDGRTVTISGETRREEREENEQWHHVERSMGRFQRSMTLPEYCDVEGIQARHENGVLELEVPKVPEEAGSGRKLIDIK